MYKGKIRDQGEEVEECPHVLRFSSIFLSSIGGLVNWLLSKRLVVGRTGKSGTSLAVLTSACHGEFPCEIRGDLPSGYVNSLLLKMVIYSGFSH